MRDVYQNTELYIVQYKVKISFKLSTTGEISEILIRNAPNDKFIQEITNTILSVDKWSPSSINDEAMESRVRFKLKLKVK